MYTGATRRLRSDFPILTQAAETFGTTRKDAVKYRFEETLQETNGGTEDRQRDEETVTNDWRNDSIVSVVASKLN